GGEYLNRAGTRRRGDVGIVRADVLQKGDGHGIGFFTGGAAGNPNTNGPVRRLTVLYKQRKDFFAQGIESAGVAKESGDMDEDVFVKLVEFFGIVFDESQVVFEVIGLVQNHAAFDAALEGGLLVVREIDALGFTKHGEELVDVAGRRGAEQFIGASGYASDV